eukprot:15451828-Alexandrium_andersonii.AAC.1
MHTCAEWNPRELRGPKLRSFQGPRSSSFERLQHLCMFNRRWRSSGSVGVLQASCTNVGELNHRVPSAKDCTDWGLEHCAELELAMMA